MPEIKIKHVVSFSSEDKVHKAENLLKAETYRKWRCATPGEKTASVVLQFEKATQIHSIDIGNDGSAFVEVFVGRSSDSVNNYQVLLVASSFMSPMESRNSQSTARVRMFGPEKLAQNLRGEKWDCVQIVCTQPFNKGVTYGLSFIKFHSPPEKLREKEPEVDAKKTSTRMGAFNINYMDEEDEQLPAVGSFFEKKNQSLNSSLPAKTETLSYAASVLASANSSPKLAAFPSTSKAEKVPIKRKLDSLSGTSSEPSAKKDPAKSNVNSNKEEKAVPSRLQSSQIPSAAAANSARNNTAAKGMNQKPVASGEGRADPKVPFNKVMERVVFVISGFVNPLRSEIRDKGLEMGAKYKGDWDSSCTHLICAFMNTPKYIQVKSAGGRIVSKDWILDCHRKKTLLPLQKYMLRKRQKQDSSSDEDSSEAESEEDEESYSGEETPSEDEMWTSKKAKKIVKRAATKVPAKKATLNGKKEIKKAPAVIENNKPNTKTANSSPTGREESNSGSLLAAGSETEDEEAIRDYLANTDADSDSGCDTEGELHKAELKAQKRAVEETPQSDVDISRPDTSNIALQELPNIFKNRHFYLYGKFRTGRSHDLQRYIVAYNGVLDDYMSDAIKYVVSDSKWDTNFEEALADNEDIIFVKSDWILKCHEAGKLLPYQPYIVIPDS